MKQSNKLLKISRFLAILSLCLVTLQTPVVVWLWSSFPQWSLVFKSVADAVILLNSLIIFCLFWQHRKKFKDQNIILVLGILYIIVNILATINSWGQWTSLLAGLVINLRFVFSFLINLVLARLDKDWPTDLVKITLTLGMMIGLFGLLQLTVLPKDFLQNIGYSKQTIRPYLTIDQNDAYIRINSSLRGPNPLGAFAVIVGTISLGRFYHSNQKKVKIDKSNLLITGLAGLMLLASFSRSAWLGGVVSIILLMIYFWKKSKRAVIVSLLSGLIILAGIFTVLIIRDDNHSLVDEFEHLVLHDNVEVNIPGSDEEHQSSIQTAFAAISDRPLLGHGTGSSGSASLLRNDDRKIIIENQFLMVWYELGLVGVMIFIVLFGVVLYFLYKFRRHWLSLAIFSSGVGLMIVGLFLPVFVDSAVAVTWWSLAGAVIGGVSYNNR